MAATLLATGLTTAIVVVIGLAKGPTQPPAATPPASPPVAAARTDEIEDECTPSDSSGHGSDGDDRTVKDDPECQTPAPSPVPAPAPTATTPTPAPQPAATPCGQSGGSCTATEVATHASPSDCWVIYNGSYYNITSFINQHPGGAFVFTAMTCGHDIAKYLSGSASSAGQRHNHSQQAYSTLASYRVGPVK